MKFQFDNDLPIYVQLVEQFKIFIIAGQFRPGERLASVRDLAVQNKVNPNTMQKALVELEKMKLVYTERTNGKYVTSDHKLIEKYKIEYANDLSHKYISAMENVGFKYEEILSCLQKVGGNK